jgi:hypothetical protein
MLVEQVQQLSRHGRRFFLATVAKGRGGAVEQVILHQSPTNSAQGFLGRRDLDEDVGAVAVFLHHPLQAANLPFNATQAPEISGLDFRVNAQGVTGIG